MLLLMQRMKKKQSVSFWAGAIMAASIAAICIISFFWMPADPEKMDTLNRFALPSAAHLLGTDQFGRDVLSRIMEASRWALLVGVCSVTVGALEACIRTAAKGLLKDVTLFDIYQGSNLPTGKKSVAFNLILRADDRSLTAQEADDEVKLVLESLEKAFGATLPGKNFLFLTFFPFTFSRLRSMMYLINYDSRDWGDTNGF